MEEENKYYVFITNNEINGKGECFAEAEGLICVEVSKEIYNNLDHYIYSNGEIILNPNYEQEQAQKEAEQVGELTMTALDFITFLRQCGLTLEQIRGYLDNNIELDTQLKYCQNVYCKVVRAIFAEHDNEITIDNVTITTEMVENAFKVKNGEL